MKKNLQKQLVISTNLFERLILGLLVSFLLQFNTLQAQTCPLACDDEVNVSLNANCEATITPAMMLEEFDPSSGCPYTVVVYGINGLPLPNPVVNSTHLGKKLRASVFLGQNSCWGYIYVEDKFRPVYICPDPDTIYCVNRSFVPDTGIYYDNCTPKNQLVKHVIYDSMVMYANCAVRTDSLIGYRRIRAFYVDLSGNHSDTCDQYIYFKKFAEKDIVWPLDTAYSCSRYNDSIPQPSESGVPKVFGHSIYPDYAACKIAVTYQDELVPICPKHFKVIRTWTVIDWCMPSGQTVYKHYQIIKVVDDRGPVLACQPRMEISTDVNSCSGTVTIGIPDIISECSEVSFQVGYKTQAGPGLATFEGTSTANVTLLSNGKYRITGLPLDSSWVVFRGTDQCGNYTDCATEVIVVDKVPPIPVCDQKTIVSLTIDGTARIDAITFDDHSVDNCEIARYEVKRMDDGKPCKTPRGNEFGPSVYFCCEDIGKNLIVQLRVWDKAGNSNTCMVDVAVQDKLPPVIKCPPPITVSCEFNYTSLDQFGTVVKYPANRKPIVIDDKYSTIDGEAIDGYAYDGCKFEIVETPIPNLKCGTGTITRIFTATDSSNNSSTCEQLITINDYTPDNLKIIWPVDYFSSTTCINSPNVDPSITGSPVLKGADKCNNIFVNYEDKVFVKDFDACLKVIRTWTVIDWCRYDPNDQNPEGEYIWKQIIKISNYVPPTFTTSCADRTIDVFGPGCGGYLDLVARANDDCTDSADLAWTFKIDLFNDGIADTSYNRSIADASGVYPNGTHKVTFTVKDACDNINTCTFLLTVRDGKKPTPYCNGLIITTVMPSTKSIEIWAKDFNLNSEDNCTPKDKLKYYFIVNNTKVPAMTFDCSNIGSNSVRVYVEDEAGNSDYCEAEIIIQDPNQVCGNAPGLTIQGKVSNSKNQSMEKVSVFLERSNPVGSALSYSNGQGVFNFKNVSPSINYTIKVDKNTEFMNGVSTADIVLIQKHILGKQLLSTPYQRIAADANNTGTISSADVSEIRRLILGITTEYKNNKSWRFIPKAYVFPNAEVPFPFVEKIEYLGISRNEMNSDFIGVKIGDVTEDSDPSGFDKISTRSKNNLIVTVQDRELIKGQETAIEFELTESIKLSGCQLNISVDPKLAQISGLDSKVISLNAENYVIDKNTIRISYTPAELINVPAGTSLISIKLQAVSSGLISKAVNINDQPLRSEIYDENVNISALEIEFRSNQVSTSNKSAKIIQTAPNPFADKTQIEFEVKKNQYIAFEIFDINGTSLSKTGNHYTKGTHKLELSRTQFGTAGIYFVRMSTNDFSETIKMILMK
ncbi:MAG: T9SS type A sorting domain-containing protein [Saprospiraceae bacterium]|nr:T9SS type A sorting domain-containing protein [Saprospiraceae bacterium]